jgi:endonuclease/exonuclease/phosphatase family metal-dependent hydrolase
MWVRRAGCFLACAALLTSGSSLVHEPPAPINPEPEPEAVSLRVTARYNTALVMLDDDTANATYRVEIATDPNFEQIERTFPAATDAVLAQDLEPTTTYYVRATRTDDIPAAAVATGEAQPAAAAATGSGTTTPSASAAADPTISAEPTATGTPDADLAESSAEPAAAGESTPEPAGPEVEPAAVTTFTTAEVNYTEAPPEISLEAPKPTIVEASWESSAEGYKFQLRFGPGKEFTDDQVQLLEDKSITLEQLQVGTTYYAQVRLYDETNDLPVSDWSALAEVTTPDAAEVRVATYNIKCYKCERKKYPWESRRDEMVELILGQQPDVIGLQEAAHTKTKEGVPQYADLVNRLGAPYATTNCGAKNAPVCTSVRSSSQVVYNTEKLKVLDHGFVRLVKSSHYLAWAIFEDIATGKQFFYGTLHLTLSGNLKNKQVDQAAKFIKDKAGDLPVVIGGDFNSNRNAKGKNYPWQVMKKNGWLDPLGNTPKSKKPAASAFVENRINTNCNSFNGMDRKARCHPSSWNGTNVDYIFVSEMRVPEYEVVMKLDSKGRFIGTIPSDHNMLRADLWIP